MGKEFESTHFSGPNIDYIDEIPVRRQSSERGSVEPAEETGPPSKKSKEQK